MSERVTVVLPVEAGPRRTLPLAPGLADPAGRSVGVVDNGLWRSMGVLVQALGADLAREGATVGAVTPFDHLADDFAEQQAALAPFATTVAGAVAGLGN